MESREDKYDAYTIKIHKMGRWLTGISILSMFAPCLGILMIYDVKVNWIHIIGGTVKVLAVFGIIGITEFFSFTPILGPGGSYLSFITGNLTTMKLPCATSALKIANAKPGTKKADIVSVLAIGTSSIVSTIICASGMLIIGMLYPVLNNEVLQPGFTNIVPALVGAMSAPYLVKSPRISSVPMLLAIIVTIILGAAFITEYDSMFSVLFIVITVVWARLLYRKGYINEGKS